MPDIKQTLSPYFKSIVDQDRLSIVICDLEHTIIYMNPAAIEDFHKYGGATLIGKSLLNCHNADSNTKIHQIIDWFATDPSHNIVYTSHNEKKLKDIYVIALRDEDGTLIRYYEKHEYRTPETMKTYDLW